MMRTKKDLIAHCLTYPEVYEDYPFTLTQTCPSRQ